MNDQKIKSADYKSRWGGVLENPTLQKLQRHCLDGFKVTGLKKILEPFQFATCLDICCGMGECALIRDARYVGLDNSVSYIQFAQREYPRHLFLVGDAMNLPFENNAFDAVYMIAATHHFIEADVLKVLKEMVRVSRKYIIIDDSVKWNPNNRVRQFFHRLDRGGMFRSPDELAALIQQFPQVKILLKTQRRTFPGIHMHATFVAEVQKG